MTARFVVKVGGGAGIDTANVLQDLAKQGREWVLVHGASDETNQLQERLGNPPRFVTSVSGHVSRFTDAETLDAFAMASGKLNLRVVEQLQRLGVNAVGLTGVDGRLLEGTHKDHVKAVVDVRSNSEDQDGGEKRQPAVTRKRVVLRGDHTGTVEKVNAGLLRLLLAGGYSPVVTVPAISYEGVAVNADADRAAAAVAGALGAGTLVILSNVAGLLRDVNDPATLVRRIPLAELPRFADFAQGRFKKKILGAEEAFEFGVSRVVFASANEREPVARALSGEIGTHVFKPGAEPPMGA